MANPFAQWALPQTPQPQDPSVAPPAPLAPPPPPADEPAAVVDDNNVFQGMNQQAPQMDTWSTKFRGKTVSFQVPRGSSKSQIRAAAKAAGVPDPQNRSIQFGEPAPEPTVEQQENNYGPIGTSLHEGADFVFPVVDEIAAGTTALGQAMLGDININQNYLNNMDWLQQRAENSEALYPGEATGGKIGAFITSLPIAAQARFLQGKNALQTAFRLAPFSAAYGGANAYLTNPVEDRWNGVPLAAAVSGGIGAATPFIGNVVSSLARRVDQRLGLSSSFARRINSLMGEPKTEAELSTQAAADIVAARIPQKVDEMRARAAEFRAAGHEPTLTNVVDETGRGFIGAMARRPGEGREIAQRAYDARRLSAPERIDRNMQAVIEASAENAPAKTAVVQELRRPASEVMADLTEKRSADIEAAMEPIRHNPVPLTPRMVEILNTADGRRAIGRAMRTVTDPQTLEAMRALPGLLKEVGSLDPRLPPTARQQIVDQLLQGRGLTVDIADRLARKFNALADTADTDAQRALRGFAREIRDEAKGASPEYRKAMEDYAGSSKTIEAMKTGEEFLGTNNADEFVAKARNIDGTPVTPGIPSDQQRAMQGARRAVQEAAGENISAAPGVARKIAVSPEQAQRNAALFGPINAEKLEKMMAITEKELRDFAQIAPGTNSQTAIRGVDDEMARGALEAMAHVKSGNPIQGALAVLRAIGVRDEDATRIVQMSVDPAQTDMLIDMLEKSYGKKTAQKLGTLLGIPTTIAESRTIGGSR